MTRLNTDLSLLYLLGFSFVIFVVFAKHDQLIAFKSIKTLHFNLTLCLLVAVFFTFIMIQHWGFLVFPFGMLNMLAIYFVLTEFSYPWVYSQKLKHSKVIICGVALLFGVSYLVDQNYIISNVAALFFLLASFKLLKINALKQSFIPLLTILVAYYIGVFILSFFEGSDQRI